MTDWPLEIAGSEAIIRGICTPYHVTTNGKLKPEAFSPTPDTDRVSVMRHDWIGTEACRRHAKALSNPEKNKVYRGLAVMSASQIRNTKADVFDSRELFDGHADIRHGFIVKRGDPLPPKDILTMRERNKKLAKIAAYYPDPDLSAGCWLGQPLRPKPATNS